MTMHSLLIQKLLSTNAHLGRRVAAHHFKIYTYGSRNAMTIIDSDKTLICLRNACQFIGNLVRQKGRFLFVNTNSLCEEIVEQMTRRIGCANDKSWKLGGFLTNSGSPKKFRSRNKKLILSAVQPPDCVVIMDTERKSSVILEADKLRIPIVGLVDSSMPWDIYKRITYPVPANDSVKFVYLFCNLITKTFLHEQKRLAATMGVAEKEDEAPAEQLSTGKAETGEHLENIKQKTDSRTNDDIFVIPCGSLTLAYDDPLETKKLLDKLVVLKLNEGLGTEMGFDGPKSAMEVCNGLTCLDLIVKQIESLNCSNGCDVPLILVNTTRTHDGILKVVDKCSNTNVDIQTLCQSQSRPVNRGRDIGDELYTLDQRELFLSLKNSGTLDALLSQGKEYILVMKSDNLGAVIDSKILNHLIQNRIQYCLEVTPYSSSGVEGNILNSHEGKFQLSDIGQIPDNHKLNSEGKFKLHDTGNLWVNLKAMKRYVETDARNAEIHPLLKFFDNVLGVSVPQTLFKPLMETSDLLLFQSDLYTYANDILTRSSARTNPSNPSIELGPEFQKLSDFRSRFKSIPSVVELDRLKVNGDVWFGTGITLKGKVIISAKPGMKLEIPDGIVLENKEVTGPSDL